MLPEDGEQAMYNGQYQRVVKTWKGRVGAGWVCGGRGAGAGERQTLGVFSVAAVSVAGTIGTRQRGTRSSSRM